MSVIQAEDLVSYQLRTNYLHTIPDGVGERLITINDSFLNTAGFKAAGWRANPANIKRTHSPPIPTAIASEYFQAPPRSAGLVLEDEVEEGGILTGGGAGDTIGTGIAIKRRRRREQHEEEDSSDLSDESDEEGEQRAAQQIKFSKMPIRNRSGSSPLRGSTLRQSSTITSPGRTTAPGVRRGSQSALEAVKERSRRDTVTSSEMSSDNELDASAFRKPKDEARNASKAGRALQKQTSSSSDPQIGVARQQSDLLEEEEEDDDSDASDSSSAFAGSLDSLSILDSTDRPMNGSPTEPVVGTMPKQLTRAPTVKSKPAPAVLQALPPPRPISMIQPKSLLSAAIEAKRTKAAMPFESFASLSGQGDPNPLSLRILAPFATSTTKPIQVLIRRSIQQQGSSDRQVTVADLIGLSLWRYFEEKIEPVISSEKLNVNRWTLRLVEDEEVDYDFPPLERNKPVVAFTTVNNRAAQRSRSNSKTFDEFALVEATDEQYQQNQALTPHFKQEAVAAAGGGGVDDLPMSLTSKTTLTDNLGTQPRLNPLLTTMSALRGNSSLADSPAVGLATNHTPTRTGVKKLLKVHIHSANAAPGQMVTLDITTDTYLAEALDMVCKKRQLDKAAHVLKLPGSGTVVLLDRTVESIGNRSELDLFRRRFATDGPLTMTGSPSSGSPKLPVIVERPGDMRKAKKSAMVGGIHPLSQEAGKQDELGSTNYRRYTVWRKQPMRFVGMNERVIAIDGEYLHIMPSTTTKTMFEGQGKTTTVHFSNVVGCKVMRRHPTTFKVVVYKAAETNKRYDFEAKSADEASEIVLEIKKGISPYHSV
ncbi:stress-activated map kinase-interacting protein-like protein [Calycina marina]|uniref:Stress-activated map kinase-interacting protein-like protein n=1 Tax=Calycina marina TaxID=1763456 RepID=A0A9P8CFM9_9HELO|nr:stress-activated map kinase-interacting protein-like protein [Calycina marina]